MRWKTKNKAFFFLKKVLVLKKCRKTTKTKSSSENSIEEVTSLLEIILIWNEKKSQKMNSRKLDLDYLIIQHDLILYSNEQVPFSRSIYF